MVLGDVRQELLQVEGSQGRKWRRAPDVEDVETSQDEGGGQQQPVVHQHVEDELQSDYGEDGEVVDCGMQRTLRRSRRRRPSRHLGGGHHTWTINMGQCFLGGGGGDRRE